LGKLAGISVSHELNTWLYGRALAAILKLEAAIKPAAKPLANCSTLCDACSATLSAHATELQAHIPDGGWLVCSCHACGEPNLLRVGPDIERMQSEGCKYVRQLSFDKYTLGAAAELKALRVARR
jgi:hypothetical protein